MAALRAGDRPLWVGLRQPTLHIHHRKAVSGIRLP